VPNQKSSLLVRHRILKWNGVGRNSVRKFERFILRRRESAFFTIKRSLKRKERGIKSSDAKKNCLNNRLYPPQHNQVLPLSTFLTVALSTQTSTQSETHPTQSSTQSSTQSATHSSTQTLTEEQEQLRQISQDSTMSAGTDSAGGGVKLYSKETATRNMAHQFMSRVLQIWNTSATLEKLPSERELALQWAGYVSSLPPRVLVYSLLLYIPCFL
jgi:hypothetical protein